jgi:hypothetical protein
MEFWCMRVIGPDELHAYPTKASAEAAASALDEAIARHHAQRPGMAKAFPPPWTVVEPWPWGSEAHAAALAKEKGDE